MGSLLRLLVVSIIVAGTALMASGQEPASTPKKKPSLSPDTAEVRFADGSTVRMFLTESAIEVTTRYGKLSVPVGEIRRIEFGFRYPEGVQARIDAAIGKLAEQDTKICEAAEKELLGFRELAYPSLKRTAAGTNRELARRAHGVIRKLEESVGAEKLKARDLDMIHAGEFTVAGKIDAPTLKGRTTYFGEVTLQVVQVRSIRFLAASGAETDLVVDAARYAALSQDVWLDTEVDVAEGAALEIHAAGEVDLWPQGGNYKVGPDAQPRRGTSADGNPSGMLLGRIGERGTTFQIGAKFTGTVSDGGRLYLRIACSPWNNASTGNYGVKINPNADSVEPPMVLPTPKTKGKAPKGLKK